MRYLAIVVAAAAAAAFSAAYRKDFYLRDYIELEGPDPVHGGRMHIVGLATESGLPSYVTLNGERLNMSTGLNPDDWAVDWVRAEPLGGFVAGAPWWVSLHSRQPRFDTALASGARMTLAVAAADGTLLANGSFAVQIPAVAATWLTTTANFSTMEVFVHYGGQEPVQQQPSRALKAPSSPKNATLVSLRINGVDVTADVAAEQLVLPANETVLWSFPSTVTQQMSLEAGRVWTLEAAWIDTDTGAALTPTVAGGILFREFFPLETWEHSSDCPFPTVNDTAYNLHRAHGVDTFFVPNDAAANCPTSPSGVDIVNILAPQFNFWTLPTAPLAGAGAPLPFESINDTSRIAAFFLADEDDTVVDDKARMLLAATNNARQSFPSLATYAGGASNKFTGAYAGITDIKGMDAYIGACAPHYAFLPLPPRGSYDYLANTRHNHMPGATWLYSQGFEDGWDGLGKTVNRQASAAEIAVQVASVPAAGAKGLMLFETQLSYLHGETAPAWATLGTLVREMAALRELYRSGDVTGSVVALDAAGSPVGTLVCEGILSSRALVVLLINTHFQPTNDSAAVCTLGLPSRFTFLPTVIAQLSVLLPVGVAPPVDAFEVFNATVQPGVIPLVAGPEPRTVVFAGGNISLGVEGPGSPSCLVPAAAVTRTFVLAFDTHVRAEVSQALQPWGGFESK